MADLSRYVGYGLQLGSTLVPIAEGSLALDNQPDQDPLQAASNLRPQFVTIRGKHPVLRATLLDPSLVTAEKTILSADGDFTSVTGFWRARKAMGAFGTAYISAAIARGLILPKSLRAAPRQRATLDIEAHVCFVAGTAITLGDTTCDPVTATTSWYPESLVIGSDTIVKMEDVSCDWKYDLKDLLEVEPGDYYWVAQQITGRATVMDLALVSQARFQDATSESVVLTLKDAYSSSTIAFDLGTCQVRATMQDSKGMITFDQLNS